jgi:hypothetical protein
VNPNDRATEMAAVRLGIPPVGDDSVDQWAYLIGDTEESPRRSLVLGDTTGTWFATNGE